MNYINILMRVINVFIDSINRKKKSDAAANPADAIANGDRVRESEQSFAELAERSERDKTR